MNVRDQKMIDGILDRTQAACPGALAMVGIYGSAATGDIHEKSDLDLLILAEDDRARKLADCFILEDEMIGYDLYCTTWEMLEEDARCSHAHLSKLMDSELVYLRDPEAGERLRALREKAREILASDARFSRAEGCYEEAKKRYAECFLEDRLPRVRFCAGGVIHSLLDAVMLFHGKYFRLGVKRTFQELPVDLEGPVLAVIRAKSVPEIRKMLTRLMKTVRGLLIVPVERAEPSEQDLWGSYEEMFSNWRNKLWEAAEREDLYSSFMNTVSCAWMLQDIGEAVNADVPDIMECFDPGDLRKNAEAFDAALERYLAIYQKAGMNPRRFSDVDAFLEEYLPKI